MVSNKALNAGNLKALGAQRLAELLMEITTGNVAARRRLRLEFAASQSPAQVIGEIRKRVAAIGRSSAFVEWQNRQALVEDLESQRRAISEQLAKSDPAAAMDLMWMFLGLANSVFERCDDRSGTVVGIFHTACADLGDIADAASPDPKQLADRAFNALEGNDYGQYDHLIEVLAPALGREGLEHLKALFVTLATAPNDAPPGDKRDVIGWSGSGPIYADEVAHRHRESTIRLALQEIADAQGDVDGFIAQQSDRAKTVPMVAAQIAQRLLAAGRVEEAWSAINAVDENRSGWIPFQWEAVRLEVMESLGHESEAQAFRWACFERRLDAIHLQAFLKRLPDFDDVETEERALTFALGFPNVHQALAFLVAWPALDRAAELAMKRCNELNGDHYEILTPAANGLAGKHPLAASLLMRAMIDFSLKEGRASRYRHAARHLADCAVLAAAIDDFGAFETHDHYVARLKSQHGRKSSFWSRVS